MRHEEAVPGGGAGQAVTPVPDREIGLVAGLLYLTGGLLGVVTVLLPAWPGVERGWIAALSMLAIAIGSAFLWSAPRLRLPPVLFVAAAGLGSVLITLAVWFGGTRGSAVYGVLFVFVAGFSFYYLPRWIAFGEVALAAAGYALALAWRHDEHALTQWLVVVGASVVGGALIGALGQRDRGLLLAEHARVTALEDVDRWRTTFLQAVAHDLRTPLTAVIGSLSALRGNDHRLPDEQQEEMLAHAATGAERLRAILDDLLDMERIAAGQIRPRLERTSLDGLVRRAVGDIDAPAHHIRISTEPIDIAVEGPKVERIVDNLVGNACRHTPAGTHVHVHLERQPEGALLTVEDDGPGIPEPVRARLFEPFAGAQHEAAAGSSGLGLSLVARFTELHGGRVWVEDRPGGGTCFRLLLPDDGTAAGR